MASQPSLYSEERKLLRIQAWEQRNQEVCQEKKGHTDNVPLFGKPYKTSKWDELSCRVQGMLGSYDDGKDPDLNTGNFVKDLLGSSSSHASIIAQLDQRQLTPGGDPAKPSFHSGTRPPTPSTPTESLARRSTCPPPARNQRSAPPAAATARTSPNYAQEEDEEAVDPCSPHVQDEEELLDMEYTRLPRMLSTLSPLARMESPLHSSDGEHSDHPREGFNPHPDTLRRPLVSPIRPPEAVGGSEPNQPPEDAQLPPAAKGGAAPAPQTFPPPLASGVVVTRKPTAYVRPMDGQDQVIMESPELKPSPESYEPIPDKGNHHHHHHGHHHHHHHHHHHNNINNNHAPLSKTLPRNPETKPKDAQCVEDILREMTHSWPPLLTTIQTPSASPTPKSPPPDKVVERVQVKPPGAEHYDSPPTVSSVSSQQNSACAVEPAHSSGVESASSSDSESSSESESENWKRSASRRPPRPQPPRGSPAEVKTTAPHGNWQLANWIRSGQQNAACASQSPPHKPPPPPSSPPASSPPSSGPRDAAAGSSAPGSPRPSRDPKPLVSLAQDQPGRGVPTKPRPARSSGKTVCKNNSAKAGRTLSPGPPAGAAPRAEPAPAEGKPAASSSLTFSYRPKVKTKTKRGSSNAGRPKAGSTALPGQKGPPDCVPKEPAASTAPCPCGKFPLPCACPAVPGPPLVALSAEDSGISSGVGAEPVKRPKPPRKARKTVKTQAAPQPPGKPAATATLLVKIELSLLCKVPKELAVRQETTSSVTTTTTTAAHQSALTTTTTTTNPHSTLTTTTNTSTNTSTSTSTSSTGPSAPSGSSRGKSVSEKGGKGSQPNKWGPTKNNNKRPAETDKNPPKKKQKMEKKAKAVDPLPDPATIKSEGAVAAVGEEKQKAARKRSVPQKQQQHCSEPKEQRTDARQARVTNPNPNPKHKKNPKKHREHPKTGKKALRSILTGQASTEPSKGTSSKKPMLRFEDRLYPVKHYIKEAKKLKHKADAEADKVSKAFGYLEAAMFFAESGVAMETEPETSKSPYSMYEDTVELIKFTLKQKNSGDSSARPSENDFTVLCLRCQAFLQMAMFRCKHKVASKYSKTLKTHFNNSKPSLDASLGSSRSVDAASPRSNVASPAIGAPSSTISSSSSGPGSNHSCGGGEGPTTNSTTTVSIPKIIHHMAFSYVNITALFVSAHDLWEKAEVLANTSSGVLSELNTHTEPLSLSSSMKAMVQYTRQALHWLRPDAQSTK